TQTEPPSGPRSTASAPPSGMSEAEDRQGCHHQGRQREADIDERGHWNAWVRRLPFGHVDDTGGESVVVLHRGSETVEHDGDAVPTAGHCVQLRTVAARRSRVTHARRVDALTAEVPAETFAIGAGLGTLRRVEQLG